MASEKQTKKTYSDLTLLAEVATVFSEMSSARMRRIRQAVLNSRDFQYSLYEVFRDVLVSYAGELKALIKSRKLAGRGKITFLAHNGKTVAVFLSANTGLYGDIVIKTFKLFAEDVRAGEVEVAIIGKLGLSLFLETFPNKPYTYFELSDFGIDQDSLGEIIRHIVQYEEVHLYFGRYENLIRQVPFVYNISAEVPLEGGKTGRVSKYIFEPTLPKVLGFFESELFSSLFNHTVYESQLAKFASRMIAMDLAYQNIETKMKEASLDALRAIHATAGKKQQESQTAVYVQEIHGR